MNKDGFSKIVAAAAGAAGAWEALLFVFILLFSIVSAVNGKQEAILGFIASGLFAAKFWQTRKDLIEDGVWEDDEDINSQDPVIKAKGDILKDNERE